LLNDLSDAIPTELWTEIANWCRWNWENGWSDKSRGNMLLPFQFWGDIFPFLGSDSSVWAKLEPLVTAEARDPLNWSLHRGEYFVGFLAHSPIKIAKNVVNALTELTVTDPAFADDRFRLLCQTYARRKGLQARLLPILTRLTQTPSQKLYAAKLKGHEVAEEEEDAAKEQLHKSFEDFLNRGSPGGLPHLPPAINWNLIYSIRWTERDAFWLPELLKTMDNPGTARTTIPYVLEILNCIVANGPKRFAEQIQDTFAGWLRAMPAWRESDDASRGGPLSAFNVQRAYERDVENALASLASSMRSHLGVVLDDEISQWVLNISAKFEITPVFRLTQLTILLASSVNIRAASGLEMDRTHIIIRSELLDACHTTLSSLWHRYRENPSTVNELILGLDGVHIALSTNRSNNLIKHELDPEIIVSLLSKLSPVLLQLAECPRASVRAELARILSAFASSTQLPAQLQLAQSKLASDARARVRNAALSGLKT
jgi:hypothetical protein